MAYKWTKASRAKLSRSQKARWKENGNGSSGASALNVPPDSVIGVAKLALSVAQNGGSGPLDRGGLAFLVLVLGLHLLLLLEYWSNLLSGRRWRAYHIIIRQPQPRLRHVG